MKQNIKKIMAFCLIFTILFYNIAIVKGAIVYRVSADGVNIRKGPGTSTTDPNYATLGQLGSGAVINVLETVPTNNGSTGCSTLLWHKFIYNSQTGYICTAYVTDSYSDPYARPWITPKKSIIGGAKFISNDYIAKGQDTSYFKKFNVNPATFPYHNPYNHQYMMNLRAPSSEAYTSYLSYSGSGLLSLPLVFSIPIFKNMPDYTALPGKDFDTSGITAAELNDSEFETLLSSKGFNDDNGYVNIENYKRKLRLLHQTYPNWIFEAVSTGLEWSSAITAEKIQSSIEIGTGYCELNENGEIKRITETGWCTSTIEVAAYYLDPRNFLNVSRILQFEKLSYSSSYTESTIQSILNSTFMYGNSLLDNQSYASIFVEAGLPSNGNISAVYLASLAKQEIILQEKDENNRNKPSKAATGERFIYNNITYEGLFNFYNIGAYSSETSPVLAGLVWASGGDSSVIVTDPIDEVITNYLSLLGIKSRSGFFVGLPVGTTVENIKNKVSSGSAVIKNTNGTIINGTTRIGTNTTIEISANNQTYTYPVLMYGDINGDGNISAGDYVLLKNHILGQTTLTGGSLLASDVNKTNGVTASDYVLIKNHILGQGNINQD